MTDFNIEDFKAPFEGLEPWEPGKLTAGDILVCSWGYDQTNIDFYRVERSTAHSVWLIKLGAVQVESDPHTFSGRIIPDVTVTEGEVFRRKIQEPWREGASQWVHIASYSSASQWNGKPMANSWGH